MHTECCMHHFYNVCRKTSLFIDQYKADNRVPMMLVTACESWCPKCESWWSKWPRPSSTSYSCYQNISYPSSVTNIDVTKNRGRWIMFENKYFIVYCAVKFLFRQNKIIILAVVMIKVIISPMHALSFMLPTWIGFKCYSYGFLKFWIFFRLRHQIRHRNKVWIKPLQIQIALW